MIETPASVQLIKELCEEGIEFISFGTNDLTQYILAVDRGNEQVQEFYNEMHPAILPQLEFVIRICKRNHVETSICGQAGSKKEMVKFLVEKGIDSISTNPDAAKEISDYVAELEKEIISGTDEEPRQYQPEKRKEKDFVPPQIIEESWEELPKIKGVEKIQQETENNKEEAITEDEPEFSSEENSKEKFDEKPENFSEQNEKFEDEPEFKEKQDNEVLDIF